MASYNPTTGGTRLHSIAELGELFEGTSNRLPGRYVYAMDADSSGCSEVQTPGTYSAVDTPEGRVFEFNASDPKDRPRSVTIDRAQFSLDSVAIVIMGDRTKPPRF